ncbi:hypothetical protein KXD96_18860 [Mycobacterium sp. SMC-2]|uniref:hypothetical protein n=1 Tax=Mycobacterium sp. SMC-2 TaxID=2857058 RepID=UPI0021B3FF6F|nr:hypothetical protein [Mycobacterium sp. SMC-2]UXA05025.1 hypothetical protein KXD96_18860 [Mycobacterium sp. SMC-2]
MNAEPSPPPDALHGRWNRAPSGSPEPDTTAPASWLWWLLAVLILVIIVLAILSAA